MKKKFTITDIMELLESSYKHVDPTKAKLINEQAILTLMCFKQISDGELRELLAYNEFLHDYHLAF